jgi:LysM repeat protein
VRVLSLLAVMLLLAVTVYACGGGGAKGHVDPNAVPTATLPNPLPQVVIVGQTSGPNGNNGGGQTYTVVSGDTLLDIANRFDVSVDDLIAINNLTDPTALFVDQVLTIPGTSSSSTPRPAATPTAAPVEAPTEAPTVAPTPRASGQTYTVQEGDIPETIAAQFDITADELMAANGITDPTSLQIGQVLVIPAPSP